VPYFSASDKTLGLPRIQLHRGTVVVGRSTDADITLDHPTLSRAHGEVTVRGGVVTVRDLNSKNGIRHNGKRLHTVAVLRNGDEVKFGDIALMFHASDVEATTERDLVDKLTGRTQTLMFLARSASGAGSSDANRLRILLRAAEALATPQPESQVAETVAQLASDIFRADRIAVLLLDGDQLVCRAARDGLYNDAAGRPYSRAIVQQTHARGRAMRFDDVRHDQRVQNAQSVMDVGIRCALAAPLVCDGEALGVLYVDSLVAAASFDDADLDMLVAFANQAGLALSWGRSRNALEQAAVVQSTLLRFFPPATAARLMKQQTTDFEPVEVEATVLFCDIAGYTELSSSLAPREVFDLLNAYFPPLAHAVLSNGGTLEKYIGDALMAVWGAPFPQEDAADRAVEAAVAMQFGLRQLNRERVQAGLAEIAVYIGIHSGPVAFGNVGTKEYVQYAAIGDATNVASRICGVAGRGEILISDTTYRSLTRPHRATTPLDPVQVKGKDEPLHLHRVAWKF